MAEAKSTLEKAPATKADLRRMNYTRRQLDEIARQLIRDGYFFYRHDFVWGFTPAFRNVRGTRFYFVAGGEIFTPRQMYTHLVKTWHPANTEEQMFFQNRLTAHFAALPQEVPAWEGMDVSEMLAVEAFQPQSEMAGHQTGAYAV